MTSDKQNEYLNRLRREFPRWGILADTRRQVWQAVRSGYPIIRTSDGVQLRETLLEYEERSH